MLNSLKINSVKVLFLFLLGLFLILGLTVVKTSFAQANPSARVNHAQVCPGPAGNGTARCHARVVVDERGNPQVSSTPAGYGPVQFRGGYNLSGSTSSTQTIAVVDAYDHPNILNDLNKYSQTFGLPVMSSCPVSGGTSSSPCFQKVDQRGGTLYPSQNSSWALEMALDVETAHAICQNCNILLVEADSNSYANLMAGVDRAVAMGAKVVSNSYGSGEFSTESSFDSHFNVPGVAFTFSSGDGGYGVEYPASSKYVTAVGGTSLFLNSNNSYQSESVWAGAGSGCSAFESKPSFQTDSGCANRTVADVSADADPSTGAAVYDSVRFQGRRGWFQVGGTSLASPIVAGVYALTGGIPSASMANSLPYSQGSLTNLHDITSGNNGSCSTTYLCTGVSGYDGPSGLGSPNGTGAF